MSNLIKALKENFPDLYKLLKNQKKNNLIFFSPNPKLYDKNSIKDKSFYYSHIFQKSRFNSSLYTNFYGKVLKEIKDKTFKTYLGWSIDKTINIVESIRNDDEIEFLQTDGICIEEKVEKVVTDKYPLTVKKCKNSKEYLDYYSQYNSPTYTYFQKGIEAMDSFIFAINNNYLLLKGGEGYLKNLFQEKIPKFIKAFSIILKYNTKIATEFVDSYIFLKLYDNIMKKLDSFYSKEKNDLKKKLEENIEKYGILELKLDKSLLKCNFTEPYNALDLLKDTKTYFEKVNCLKTINTILIKEIKTVYETTNRRKLEIQTDLLVGCWSYILSHYIAKDDKNNIFLDYLFFKYFKFGNEYDENDYIIKNFMASMQNFENELLRIENAIDQKPSTQPIKVISLE